MDKNKRPSQKTAIKDAMRNYMMATHCSWQAAARYKTKCLVKKISLTNEKISVNAYFLPPKKKEKQSVGL